MVCKVSLDIMKLWLLIIAVFLGQELITTNAVLLEAYKEGYPLWPIHILFIACTIFISWFCYFLGKWAQKRFGHTKIIRYSQTRALKINGFLGNSGQRMALFVLGFIGMVQAMAFLASWLDLSLSEVIFLLCLGDIIWYVIEWLVVLGANAAAADYAIYIVIGISLILTVGIKFAARWFGVRGKE